MNKQDQRALIGFGAGLTLGMVGFSLLSRSLCKPTQRPGKKAAVILHGSGVYDGSEITEAVGILRGLSRRGVECQCFAPDANQHHVIDHTKGSEAKETRNVMKESARISRGDVKALSDLSATDYDCLLIPGGFGAAKNLSSFAFDGEKMKLNSEVEGKLKQFVDAKKPIGLCCIAPMLVAKLGNIMNKKFTLTLGCKGDEQTWPYQGALDAAAALGNNVVEVDLDKVCVDSTNKIVTSAAYMKAAKPHEIVDNVDMMVEATLKLC